MPQPQAGAHRDAAGGKWKPEEGGRQIRSESVFGFRLNHIKGPQISVSAGTSCSSYVAQHIQLVNTQHFLVLPCFIADVENENGKKQQKKSFWSEY